MKHFVHYVILSSCVWRCLEALYYKNEILEEELVPVFKFNEKSYYVGELKLTYLEADLFCKNIDMKLVAIHSSKEFEALWDYIRNTSSERKFWSSGSRLLDGVNWIWMSTLENVKFTKWKPGEPNNQNNEQCIEFLSSDNNFLFNDKNCNIKTAFICEKDNGWQQEEESDNSKEADFHMSLNINLLHFSGKSYFIENNFEGTFLQASQFCHMIQMELVSVISEAENNILHKYIRDTMAGHSFWSSGTKAIDGKSWVWLSTRTPIVFTQWERNQPSNTKQLCIELVQYPNDGLFWNDDDCDDLHYFICESYEDYAPYEIGPIYSTKRIVRSADGYTYQYGHQDADREKPQEKSEKELEEEAERETKYEAGKKAREEAAKKAKEHAEEKAKEELENKAKEEAVKKGEKELEEKENEKAEKKTKEEAEKKAKKKAEKEKSEKKTKEQAEKKAKERAEKEEAEKKEREEKKKEKEQKKDALKYEITLDGGRYRFSNIKVNHEEAAETCKQYGLELISILNEEKNVFVNNLIKQYGKSDGKYWTSGTKKYDDQWIWRDLQPITYFNWAPSEPDKDQYCLQVRATGLWHDQDCDRNSLFICESSIYSTPSYSNTYSYTYQANVDSYYSSSY